MPLRRSNINKMEEKHETKTFVCFSSCFNSAFKQLLTHHSRLFQFKIKPKLHLQMFASRDDVTFLYQNCPFANSRNNRTCSCFGLNLFSLSFIFRSSVLFILFNNPSSADL